MCKNCGKIGHDETTWYELVGYRLAGAAAVGRVTGTRALKADERMEAKDVEEKSLIGCRRTVSFQPRAVAPNMAQEASL